MEMQCGQSNPAKSKRTKISLEEYLDFIESHKQFDLTVNYLNQIISMHGFKRLTAQKKVLIDAVNSMDLMHPSRSTIYNDDVSSCAFIAMEEAMKDLFDLNWQECSVTSFQTLNSVNHDFGLQNPRASTTKSKPKKSRSRSRTKVPRLKGVDDCKAIVTAAIAVTGSGNEPSGEIGETQSACSAAAAYRYYNRKRKMKSVNALITDSDSTGEFSKVIV